MTGYNLRLLQLHTPADTSAELLKLDVRSSLLRDYIAQGTFHAIKLERVPAKLARFLYQELTLEGGTVALSPFLDERTAGDVDVLLLGTHYQLQHLAIRLHTQTASDLDLLASELKRALDLYDHPMQGTLKIGASDFQWGARTYVMGILNVTPDSFSGDGVITSSAEFVGRAVEYGEELISQGADVLDIGGESTRPGSQPISAEEERARVIPVIQALRLKSSLPISIDTYR
ncbi:MAG TPA: dihydropteroate synthase, partial [Anaerolineae bacterium]